jgi:phage terminase large subunit-like protein
VTTTVAPPALPEDWRDWPPGAKMRLRWRLSTDWDPKRPRPNQLTPDDHALCVQSREACEAAVAEADALKLELEERVDYLAAHGHVSWLIWLILTGRGWGKTRVGAEDVAKFARETPYARIALVAATFADGRDTMVEGESGLLSVLHPSELKGGSVDKAWNRSVGELIMANGSRFKVYSSEKPGRLRGPQHHRAWCDELAAWENLQDTWDMLMFGLRLGEEPKVIITTTPKPKKLIIDIRDRPATVLTRGRMRENAHNLSQATIAELTNKYGGTDLGRQELEGELIEEAEGALWTRSDIEATRAQRDPLGILDLVRIVVAVDPAVTATVDSDETGIVVVGKTGKHCPVCNTVVGSKRHALVLADISGRLGVLKWGRRVVDAYHSWECDKVIAEVNNGGDLVESNIQVVNSAVTVKKIHASRGKRLRAQPVANLYQQGRVHHVMTSGSDFNDLEDQMCTWDPEDSDDSPDRLDALVYGVTELLIGFPAGSMTQRENVALEGRR